MKMSMISSQAAVFFGYEIVSREDVEVAVRESRRSSSGTETAI